MNLLLDTGVLGQVCHPRKYPYTRHEKSCSPRRARARGALRSRDDRDVAFSGQPLGVVATNRQSDSLPRRDRRDVLIAAQAIAENAAVVSTNPRHFAPLVQAMTWNEVV